MKQFILILSALLLVGCGQTAPQNSYAPETQASEAVETQESSMEDIKSEFRIVQPEEVTEGRRDKLSIDDIYVYDRKGEKLLVIDYNFKQCYYQEPSSFADTYNDEVYINGIEAEHFYGDIEGTEAGYDTKILGLSKAHVYVGYKIKDFEAVKEKDFRLFLVLKNGAVMYEIEGNISKLRVEKE